MKKEFILPLPFFLIFLYLLLQIVYSQETSIEANKGILDLTKTDDTQHNLSGEWEFYWGELLTPEDFKKQSIPVSYTVVPHQWHDVILDGEKLSRFGYATYRLTILFPKEDLGTVKAVALPNIASSYQVWINGDLIVQTGRVGTTENSAEPANESNILSFIPYEQSNELVIQVSNYAQRKSGIWSKIELGNQREILNEKINNFIMNGLIIGGLLVIGIYHFVMYCLRRKEKSSLFFSLTCIGLAVRILFLEGIMTGLYYPNASWELELKFEYISTYLAVTFFNYFIHYFLGYQNRRIYLKSILIIHCLLAIFVLITPGKISTLILPYYSIFLVVTFLNLLFLSFKALKHKQKTYLFNFIAICLFSICLLNDCLYYLDFVHTTDLVPFGLLAYVFFQAILLSARITNSFNKEELLREELKEINSNLEGIVKKRTEETIEINKQLQNSLNARIDLISSISHEMRSPLTTIKSYSKGMIDGIIKDDNQQYVQMIHEETIFMERMLDDLFELSFLELRQYKFYFEKVEPKVYFKKLYEKYHYEVVQSGLQFHFRIMKNENIEIMIDPIRMEQVFVNLVRNALKNTEKGSISIEISCETTFLSFSIIDTGDGIKPELLPLIFTKFIKDDNKRNLKSNGIGLSICKEIVKTHGGDISVSSVVGEGSRFTVIIPARNEHSVEIEEGIALEHS